MKVKTNWPEYREWISEGQLARQGKAVLDRTKAVTLWTNPFCQKSCLYTSPDNVRDMTFEEKTAYRAKINEQHRIARKERITKKLDYERGLAHAEKVREEWHTDWQWLRDYHRISKIGTLYRTGESLNREEVFGWTVFGSNYDYCHIDDTILLTDPEEIEEAFRKSDEAYKQYHGSW